MPRSQENERYRALASDFVRTLRGGRSQRWLSAALGRRCNVVYTWEAGLRFPGVSTTLAAAAACGVDVRAALSTVATVRPRTDPTSPSMVVSLLESLRGARTITELSRSSGFSRFALGRWLSGEAQPRLPDFLRLLDRTTPLLLAFTSAFVDPSSLPLVARQWEQSRARERLEHRDPFSMAVLRVFELSDYRRLPRHDDRWVAERLGIGEDVVARTISELEKAALIERDGSRWRSGSQERLEWLSPAGSRDWLPEIARFWLEHGARNTERGRIGYVLFTLSERDLARLREAHARFIQAVSELGSETTADAERIALVTAQILPLDRRG